jgi:hypothetical protein
VKTTIAIHTAVGDKIAWQPTTLDKIDKPKGYLESIIAEIPELLLLESRRTGVHGPYAVFTQLPLLTPQSRGVTPDILILTGSGDIVVVEIKLSTNPELRDRRVIAQTIDYASSLSALTETELAKLFSKGQNSDWGSFVGALFQKDMDPEELAATLLAKIQTGHIQIVIACDKAPIGLYELAKSISKQSYLSFSLDVVEVTPFIKMESTLYDPEKEIDIMFVPYVRLSTEIVARTAISVTFKEGTPQPTVDINTTSMEEIEENIVAAKEGTQRAGRKWTDQEVEEAFISGNDPIAKELFEFVKRYSHNGQFLASGKKQRACFGFYIHGYKPDGSDSRLQAFNYAEGDETMTIFVRMISDIAPPHVLTDYKQGLKGLFGDMINLELKEPNIKMSLLGEKLDGFKSLILKLHEEIGKKPIT